MVNCDSSKNFLSIYFVLFSTFLLNDASESINKFDTGKQLISIYGSTKNPEYIVIDPRQIVLSLEKLDSSMQNSFHGRIIDILKDDYDIRLNIDIGEHIQAIITYEAFNELKLSLKRVNNVI